MGILKTVKLKKIDKFLKARGFTFERQSASHLIYDGKGLPRPFVIPFHGKEIKFCYVKQIYDALGMTREQFIGELKKF